VISDENLPTSSTHRENPDDLPAAQLHSHGEMVGSRGPVTKAGTSLDAIRFVLHKRQTLANVDKMKVGYKDDSVAPLRPTPSMVDTATKTEVSSAPTIVEALVDDVEALSMTNSNEDIQMEYSPLCGDPAPSVADPEPSVLVSSVLPANEDFSEDEIDDVQSRRYRERPVIPNRQPSIPDLDAEDDSCDLAYPDSDPAVSS
jgi:hypothetical protein